MFEEMHGKSDSAIHLNPSDEVINNMNLTDEVKQAICEGVVWSTYGTKCKSTASLEYFQQTNFETVAMGNVWIKGQSDLVVGQKGNFEIGSCYWCITVIRKKEQNFLWRIVRRLLGERKKGRGCQRGRSLNGNNFWSQ